MENKLESLSDIGHVDKFIFDKNDIEQLKDNKYWELLARQKLGYIKDDEKVYKFISSKEKEFRGTYPLGMEDLDLLDDATEIVQDINRNRALKENIQGTIFDKQNEAAQIEAMKKILLDRSRRK